MTEKLYRQIGEYTPDNLIASHDMPILVKGIKLAKNQGIVTRGTVLGIITATGLAKPADMTKADGTEKAFCITTDTINTDSETDISTTAYVSGIFNKNALLVGGADTISDHETKLREMGIFLKDNILY